MCSLVVWKGLTEIQNVHWLGKKLRMSSAEEQCLLNKSGDWIYPGFSSYCFMIVDCSWFCVTMTDEWGYREKVYVLPRTIFRILDETPNRELNYLSILYWTHSGTLISQTCRIVSTIVRLNVKIKYGGIFLKKKKKKLCLMCNYRGCHLKRPYESILVLY